MQLSEFAFRIILLFIPGLISFIIVDNLTVHKEYKLHMITIYSLVLGFLCYITYYILINIICSTFKINLSVYFINIINHNEVVLNLNEIIYVSILSVLLGLVFTFIINYKIIFRIAQILKISNKIGDIDVWSYIMNLKIPEWVVIRDRENNIMYEGWIQAFSDSTGKDEIFLRDVIVYENLTGDEMYRIPGLYLPRNRSKLIIEFPEIEFTELIERPPAKGEGEDVKKSKG